MGLCPEAPGGQPRGWEEPLGAFPRCPWAAAPLPAALTHPCVPQALPRAYSIIAPVLPPLWEANLMPNASRSSPKCDCFSGRGPKPPVICSPDNGNVSGAEQRAAPCAQACSSSGAWSSSSSAPRLPGRSVLLTAWGRGRRAPKVHRR